MGVGVGGMYKLSCSQLLQQYTYTTVRLSLYVFEGVVLTIYRPAGSYIQSKIKPVFSPTGCQTISLSRSA